MSPLCQFEMTLPAYFPGESRTVYAGDNAKKWEVSGDADRTLLLRGTPRGGDRRAVARGRLSLHGVPTAYRFGLRRQHLLPEGSRLIGAPHSPMTATKICAARVDLARPLRAHRAAFAKTTALMI
jgi:hypothetical protein